MLALAATLSLLATADAAVAPAAAAPLQPDEVSEPAGGPPQPAPLSRGSKVTLISALVGAAVTGTGVGLRLAAGSNYDRIDRGYPALGSYDQLVSVRRQGELMQALSFGFLAAGVATLVVGVVISLFL
ncbi:MAG: hypothetical protein IPJ65_33810 [Archangiaceae bacterium]|nr:hypothetical protein [Archangiaceae bacterium]